MTPPDNCDDTPHDLAGFMLRSREAFFSFVVIDGNANSRHSTRKLEFMAQVLGESGRYASQEAARKRQAILGWVMLLMGFAGMIMGFLIRGLVPGPAISSATSLPAGIALLLLMCGAGAWTLRKARELDKQRANFSRGADGENSVAAILERLPDEFRVINDLTTPYGNLDHVVVGPSGVFCLDTKNWQGVVSADGKGELLCNGKPLDRPCVRQFVGRVMGIKDRVKALASAIDPYFKTVFVFPSARVDANWGTTGNLHCIRDDQLFKYIVESKTGNRLTKEEVNKLAKAFLGLPHMDMDFTDKAARNGRLRISAIVQARGDRANPPLVRLTPSLGRSRN